MKLCRISLALAAATLAFAGTARAQEGTPIAGALAVETFDSAWAVIDRTLWDTTFNGVDWDAVREELRPRAQSARTYQELRSVLGEMVGRLGLSHFGIIPGDVQDRLAAGGAAPAGGAPGDAGLELRLVGERFLVTRVAPGGAAAAAGVRPGWAVDAVEGRPAREVLALVDRVPTAREPRARQLAAWAALSAALRGRAGERLRVRFEDGAGRAVEKALVLGPAAGTATKVGNLPELAVRAEHERLRLDDGTSVGVIRFNYWMPVVARRLDEAVDALRDADGIVIDLRGNLGGVGVMAAGFAGHFLDRADTLGTMRMRQGPLHFVVNPRRVDARSRPARPFAGPVAILVDALSVSTSEIFAGGLRRLGRARVFGETTAGQALPSYARRLPNGDVLQHAVADFTGPGGERFEGAGVAPDVAAPPTREALLAGGDPALDAAVRWIREERARGRAPR
ncbi:MAG TPA: S41 family peptidase [Longimicrobium sp.]